MGVHGFTRHHGTGVTGGGETVHHISALYNGAHHQCPFEHIQKEMEFHCDMLTRGSHRAGLPRPVLLRRAKYHALLEQLLAENDASWSDLVVVGDIFELDLALYVLTGYSWS